jgi:hypothetical protein
MTRNPAAFAILGGGLTAGIFDITYAIVFSSFRGVTAIQVLQSVASGFFGMKAYDGGMPVAILGLFLHFFIALSWAAIFYVLSRRIQFLREQAIISGLLYGVVIYAVMNLVVIPLSAYPHKVNFSPSRLAINLFVHMFLIGLPIALAVRKAANQRLAARLISPL